MAGNEGSVRPSKANALRAEVRHRLVAEDDVSPPALEGVSDRIARVRTLEVQRPANAPRRRDHLLSVAARVVDDEDAELRVAGLLAANLARSARRPATRHTARALGGATRRGWGRWWLLVGDAGIARCVVAQLGVVECAVSRILPVVMVLFAWSWWDPARRLPGR